MLLDAAAQEAKRNGCMTILIKTYSFQAPAFYMKNGFNIKHTLDNFPQGYVYYTLTKKLSWKRLQSVELLLIYNE